METIILAGPRQRGYAARRLAEMPDDYVVVFDEPRRTHAQNRLLWPLLADVSRQVEWHGQKLSPDDWKDMFTASLKKTRVIPGIDGGFVTCGLRTSKMSRAFFSELVELIQAFGAERDVKWSTPDPWEDV